MLPPFVWFLKWKSRGEVLFSFLLLLSHSIIWYFPSCFSLKLNMKYSKMNSRLYFLHETKQRKITRFPIYSLLFISSSPFTFRSSKWALNFPQLNNFSYLSWFVPGVGTLWEESWVNEEAGGVTGLLLSDKGTTNGTCPTNPNSTNPSGWRWKPLMLFCTCLRGEPDS